MTSFPKLVWSIVGFALFVVGVYFLFQDNHVFDVIFPKDEVSTKIKYAVEGARDRIYAVVSPVVNPIINQGKEIISGLYGKAKDEVAATVDKARESAVGSVKKTVNEKIDNVAKDIGFGAGGTGGAAAVNVGEGSPLGFSVKAGVPAIFILKNPESIKAAVSFSIDWGDGKKEVFNVDDAAVKTVYHVWNKVGEYKLEVFLAAGDTKEEFKSYIVVY